MKKRNQNNKVILVLLGILVVCFVLLGIAFYKFFYAGSSHNKYGDRLDDIDKYPLSKNLNDDVKELLSEDEKFDSVSIDVKGKIIYININFKPGISTGDAKNLATKSLEAIGDDNLTYYDVQYILTMDDEEEPSEEDGKKNYPVFGAKSANSNKVVW